MMSHIMNLAISPQHMTLDHWLVLCSICTDGALLNTSHEQLLLYIIKRVIQLHISFRNAD